MVFKNYKVVIKVYVGERGVNIFVVWINGIGWYYWVVIWVFEGRIVRLGLVFLFLLL